MTTPLRRTDVSRDEFDALQKQVDTLASVLGTHRHGYRWEPVGRHGQRIEHGDHARFVPDYDSEGTY